MRKRWIMMGAMLTMLPAFISAMKVHAAASDSAAVAQATRVADAWLKLVDDGDYKQSWESASSIFKNAITDDQWEQRVGAVREPLGKFVSRKLKAAHYATSLPGAPTGSMSSSGTRVPFRTRNPRWRR